MTFFTDITRLRKNIIIAISDSMKRHTLASLLLSTSLCSLNVNAESYTVQIGAYERPSAEVVEQAKAYGQVFKNTENSQLTKITIGHFDSRSQANAMRDKLKRSAYPDAFVTTSSKTGSSQTGNYSNQQETDFSQALLKEEKSLYETTAKYQQNKTASKLSDLNDDERSKASYLDGQLRILSNDKFLTVEQYRRSQ